MTASSPVFSPRAGFTDEPEPIKPVRPKAQTVGALLDLGKRAVAEQLDGSRTTKAPEVEPHGHPGMGEVVNHEERFSPLLPDIRQNPPVGGVEELGRTTPERRVLFTHGDHPPQPAQ